MKNKICILLCSGIMCAVANAAMAAQDNCQRCEESQCYPSLEPSENPSPTGRCKLCGDGGCYVCCNSSNGGDYICMETSWTNVSGTKYQSRTTCIDGLPLTIYQCQAGYYGPSGGNVEPTCTSCATATGNSNATSSAGSTVITSCYVPNGTAFDDTAGSGTYGSDCYYTE